MSIIKGFKAFNAGLISVYDFTFEENKCYHVEGEVVYRKNGFHFCEHLEDTLKYYTNTNNDVDIAKVIGFGKVIKKEVEGFSTDDYEVCVASDIKILNKLTREEIIEEMQKHQYNLTRMTRFITCYKLTDEEIKELTENFEYDILNSYIEYYQYGDKDTKKRKKKR